jgi:hypothetical protein
MLKTMIIAADATVLSVGSAWGTVDQLLRRQRPIPGQRPDTDLSIWRSFDFLLRPQRPVCGQLAPPPLA